MIETSRLKLIPFTENHFKAILNDDNVALVKLLGVQPIQRWSEFDAAREAIHALHNIQQSLEGDWRWGAFFILLASPPTLIGTCGFLGKPDEENCVEIGYEIHPHYQEQGFATETVKALTQFAFSQKVDKVKAHTLAEKNASNHVLQKCGFRFSKAFTDPNDGPVWQWTAHRTIAP